MSNGSDFALNFFLWMFIPSTLTSFLQARFYGFFYGKGAFASKKGSAPKSVPRPGSDAFSLHHNVIYSLVVGGYLLYCIANIFYSAPKNYYEEFGLSRSSFTPKELRSKYKAATLLYHPDKDASAEAAAKFAKIKGLYEVLNDADKRSVYESFGDMQCVNCQDFRQFLYAWLPESLMFYGVSTLVLIIMNVFGRRDYAQSVRYLSILGFFSCELWLLFVSGRAMSSATSAGRPFDLSAAAAVAEMFLGKYTASQRIKILREFSIYFFIFLSQICPVWFPDKKVRIKEEFEKAGSLADLVAKDVTEQATNAFEPFNSSPETMLRLKRAIEKTAIELKLFEKDDVFRKKYISALTKRNKN